MLKRYREAVEDLQRALFIDPNDESLYRDLTGPLVVFIEEDALLSAELAQKIIDYAVRVGVVDLEERAQKILHEALESQKKI